MGTTLNQMHEVNISWKGQTDLTRGDEEAQIYKGNESPTLGDTYIYQRSYS